MQENPVPNFAFSAQLLQIRESNVVTHQIPGVAQEYIHLFKVPDRNFWEQSFENELGQLAQGIRTVRNTNTVIFISKTELKPEKEEKERTRLTVG